MSAAPLPGTAFAFSLSGRLVAVMDNVTEMAGLAVPLLAAAAVLLLWNRTLRRHVSARTAELSDQKRVMELIAEGAPLPITLDALARAIETQAPGVFCSILLLDAD